MTPRDAARRFARLVLRATFGDMLDLADPHDGNHGADAGARRAAYADVESVVRRRFRATHDLNALEQAVRLAAPDERREAVSAAVSKLSDAVVDEVTVKQQAAYAVGVAVGRALRGPASRGAGDGWKARER